jgi:hypothetical protein
MQELKSWTHSRIMGLAMLAVLAGCMPDAPSGAASSQPAEEQSRRAAVPEVAEAAVSDVETAAAAERWARAKLESRSAEQAVCYRFVQRIAEEAQRHSDSSERFLEALQDEFTGGTGNPFEMKTGLRTGEWNEEWFYAGHGGFRPEYDDAQRYPRGGNHQPGHFVAVLSIAAAYGRDAAEIAIAYAGDYDEGEEDDLRLSMEAIRLGSGLKDGSLTPAQVADAARGLCR